jgi:flagellar basal-body rod modification protein FlgD
MSSTSSVTSATGTQAQQSTTSDAWTDLGLEEFISLLVTELENQDPTQPMENSEIMQQVAQISSIQSTSTLNTTMEAVILGENLATASNLINREVTGLSDDAKLVTGEVTRVAVSDGSIKIYISDDEGTETAVDLANVSQIYPTDSTNETTTNE